MVSGCYNLQWTLCCETARLVTGLTLSTNHRNTNSWVENYDLRC